MANEQKPSNHPLPSPDRRRACRRQDDLRLVQRDKELDAAQQACQTLFQHHRLDELVEKALRTAMAVVNAEAGSILLADPDTQRLVFRYVIGEKAALLHGTAFPWNEGIAGSVFQSGEPAVIPDVKQDRRHFPGVDLLTGYKTRDMITLPLKKWEGEPIGVLNVLNKRNGVLSKNDLAHLTIISTVAAVAIQQARLFEEAKLAEVVRLVGDIGHDLKNLLQPVVSGMELLKEELAEAFGYQPNIDVGRTQESQRLCAEVIDMVQGTFRRIKDRMKQIADCVKGLSAPPKFAPCSLAIVVEGVLKTLRTSADEKGISVRAEGLDPLPLIIGDEHRLFNALYNLVNNAIPEVPRGGSVTVLGRLEAGAAVVMSVADTGRGMPPKVRQSLFTARAISTKPGGTGLGTKIVKDVVDAHKGQITVESELGVGTTFHIRLPLDPTRLEAARS